MNRDTHPGELTNEEYSFALNTNIQDEHGNGRLVLQNEPSNIKCTGFKSGYKVIGHKFDINDDRTYFFLTNPTTGCSEIGYVDSISGTEGLEAVEKECDCDISVVIETPQQDEVQNAICQYFTIVSDCCERFPDASKCLGFSVDHPIKEGNIVIKDEKIGKRIYWTDNFNPQRYINLDNIDNYYQIVDDCEGTVTDTCLQCDKMRVFPEFDKPCINVVSEEFGGSLKAGVYEVLVSYGSINGDVLSNWYSITNPFTIHDSNNNVLDQTNLDYITSKSIKLKIEDLDNSYSYYNVAVIYRSGLDQSVTYKKYGTYPISMSSLSINSLNDKENITIQDLLSKRPMYLRSEGLSSANGYLLHNGLKTQREINLQPVVNLMGSLVKWSTVQAPEDLYDDGSNVSNYTGYMRDEVVPLSIQFFMDGGYESPVFPFIPRPAKGGEKDVLDSAEFPTNTNTDSVLDSYGDCSELARNERWQFENTAEVIGDCVLPAGSGSSEVEVVENEDFTCVVTAGGEPEVLDTVASGTLNIGSVSSLVNYVNNNASDIIASTDPEFADIKNILEDPSEYTETCDSDFGDHCGAPVLSSEEMVALSVETEEIEEVASEDLDDYEVMQPPTGCSIFEVDDVGDLVQNTAFMSSWMRAGQIVYTRKNPYTNTSCNLSTSANVIPVDLFLQNEGSNNITDLQQATINTSQVSLPEYTSKLHSNALWYKVDFNGQDFAVFEVSAMLCNNPDDNNGDSIRINVFDSCSSTNDLPAYSEIVNDMTLLPDADKFVFLDAADFPSGSAYVAIDSAMRREVDYELQLSGDSGEITVTIDGVNYSMPFDTDLATTASNFVSNHSTDLSNNHNISASVNGNNVSLRADRSYVALTSTTSVSGDLTASIVIVQSYETLTPPCGCFSVRTQGPVTGFIVNFTNLTFGKKQTYTAECTYNIPDLKGCKPTPYEKGYFSYWESSERYVCNNELYNSSSLIINQNDISNLDSQDISDFEDFYVDSVDGSGNYTLNSDANFMDKPIRHYKFPDSRVSPFMSKESQKPGFFNNSVIYPIGFNIDNKVVSSFLDIAYNNGLISIDERLKIRKYEIFRGDRRTDKSIVAKGLLFDMYRFLEEGELAYYPNFPLNSLGLDQYNSVTHPFGNAGNNKYTFHSPEVHFFKPSLPNEINIEGYVYGDSYTVFDTVEDHPTYVLLGEPAFNLATTLAIAEITLDVIVQSIDWVLWGLNPTLPYNTVAAVAVAAAGVVSLASAIVFKQSELKYKWINIFRDLGNPENFAYYSATVGKYTYFKPNLVANSTYRGIPTSNYLNSGYFEVAEENTGDKVNVNNLDREDSVYLSLGSYSYNTIYPSDYTNFDNVDITKPFASRKLYSDVGTSSKLIGRSASPYVGLKRYLPSQYGSLESVEWLNTGYCGKISESNDCDPIFGGDTYISRFALKRKIPFFTQNSMGLAPLTPFKYSDYFNINSGAPDSSKYYIDYLTTNNGSFAILNPPNSKSEYSLYPGVSSEPFYIKPEDGKFFLFSYGFPYFLVESQINCNYRYAKREIAENFYPNFSDIIRNTQEKNISIREQNTYFYNSVYSSSHTRAAFRTLPVDYSKSVYDRLSEPGNSVIYSRKDGSETSTFDPWLSYRAVDAYEFPKSYGKLISMDELGSEQLLGRFTNGITIFGALDMLADRIAPETKNIGTGGIFTGRNINFNKTDLGYAGTQHTQIVNTDFGHFWADAKRGKVFKLEPNGKGLGEITPGLEKWFKENLPFKILHSFPETDIDNNYNGIGIAMGWDDRLKRLFITKKDYKLKGDCPPGYVSENGSCVLDTDVRTCAKDNLFVNGGFDKDLSGWTVEPLSGNWIWDSGTAIYNGVDEGGTISQSVFTVGEEYEVTFELCINYQDDTTTYPVEVNIGGNPFEYDFSGCQTITEVITASSEGFSVSAFADGGESHFYSLDNVCAIPYEEVVLDFTDEEFFEDCSWTVAYSPLTESWISYYSFKPNYYVNYHNYFQTGLNTDDVTFGLWSHLSFLSSYQVFYGQLYPFTIEYPNQTQLVNSVIQDVEFYLDVRKYYNKYDYTDIYGQGFNKAVIYNNHQNTGLLNLFHQKENDMRQLLDYPKFNSDSIDILQSEIHGKWSFNYLYNSIKNEKAGLPVWKNDCSQVDKFLDSRLLNYRSTYRDRMRGDYFLVRLTQDIESRYKMLFRFAFEKRHLYEQ